MQDFSGSVSNKGQIHLKRRWAEILHADSFARLLDVLMKEYQSHMEQHLAPHLTTSQFTVLELLTQQGALKPSDLLPFLATTPAAVTMLLDRMERALLIRRERDEADRRIVWIYITELGLDQATRGTEIRRAYLDGILDHLSTHNQQLLIYLMGKITSKTESINA